MLNWYELSKSKHLVYPIYFLVMHTELVVQIYLVFVKQAILYISSH